jgi:cytochrome c oxidase assembly protein subunit 15
MFLAVLLLFGLLYLKKYCEDLQDTSIVPQIDLKALGLSKLLVTLIFGQILMGTQVRQQVDYLMRDSLIANPDNVVSQLGWFFYLHRSFSILIVIVFLYLLFYFHRSKYNRHAFFLTLMSLFCVLANILSGIVLNYFQFPASAQPPHLFFGILSVGLIYGLVLHLKGSLLED